MTKKPQSKEGARAGNKRATANSSRTAPSANNHGLSIHMYRLGVGDCFLVSFRRDDGGFFRMLIDCGVHQSQTGGSDLIRTVVADIKNRTGGHIDVIVATHEHWDHISGFSQAEELFRGFTVGEVWVAWTENSNDGFAQSLKEKRGRAVSALGQAEARMKLAGLDGAKNPLTGMLGFFGDTTGKKLAEAGRVLRGLAGRKENIRYREPGEAPIELPGVKARIFVLGPPRDKEAIGRSDPRKSGGEVYSFGSYATALDAIESALRSDVEAPFDGRFAIPLVGTKALPFFQQRYWADRAPEDDRDRMDTTQDWRRIDDDWLEAATSLGLKLDEDTNNTSLVLAIELGPPNEDGPVLLFAADAQVGNWLSWQRIEWNDYSGRRISGPDLLRRTIIYKVGHHASHNATLREAGLELMDALELALVTTDDKMAEKVGWGTLPWPKLLERLEEKTAGHVIRTDRALGAAIGKFEVKEDPLFYQIDL